MFERASVIHGMNAPIVPAPPAQGEVDILSVLGLCHMAYIVRWEEDGAAPASVAARHQNAGLEVGDAAEYLSDWSPNGHHLRQTSASFKPVLVTAGTPDGVAALDFDGSAYLDSMADVELPDDVYVLLCHHNTTGGSGQIWLNHGNPIYGSGGWVTVLRRTPAEGYLIYQESADGFYNIQAMGTLPNEAAAGYDRYLWRVTTTAATLEHAYNGVDEVTSTLSTSIPGGNRTYPVRLGAVALTGGSQLTGHLRGCLVMPGTTTPEQLADAWALLEGT